MGRRINVSTPHAVLSKEQGVLVKFLGSLGMSQNLGADSTSAFREQGYGDPS